MCLLSRSASGWEDRQKRTWPDWCNGSRTAGANLSREADRQEENGGLYLVFGFVAALLVFNFSRAYDVIGYEMLRLKLSVCGCPDEWLVGPGRSSGTREHSGRGQVVRRRERPFRTDPSLDSVLATTFYRLIADLKSVSGITIFMYSLFDRLYSCLAGFLYSDFRGRPTPSLKRTGGRCVPPELQVSGAVVMVGSIFYFRA